MLVIGTQAVVHPQIYAGCVQRGWLNPIVAGISITTDNRRLVGPRKQISFTIQYYHQIRDGNSLELPNYENHNLIFTIF